MRMKLILILLFISFQIHFSQKLIESRNEKLEINAEFNAAHPQFMNDDTGIIFTTPNYKGLYGFDFGTKEIKNISFDNGAGYYPLITNDKNVIFRSFKIKNGKKYFSLKTKNLLTGEEVILESEKRNLKLPRQTQSKNLMFLSDEKIINKPIQTAESSGTPDISVISEDNDLILIQNKKSKIISPLGKGVYVWESLSRDGKFILFTYSNKGSFICDLNGNILDRIPDAHYPRFSPDGRFISFMVDEDDGDKYTASDIYIYSLGTKETFSVTNTDNEIEMYAEWSNDGTKLVYHTLKGEIYIADLRFEN